MTPNTRTKNSVPGIPLGEGKVWRVIEFVRKKNYDEDPGYDVRVLHRGKGIGEAADLVLAYKAQGRHTTVEEDK